MGHLATKCGILKTLEGLNKLDLNGPVANSNALLVLKKVFQVESQRQTVSHRNEKACIEIATPFPTGIMIAIVPSEAVFTYKGNNGPNTFLNS